MTDPVEDLERRLAEAVEAEDFETAALLRDAIANLKDGTSRIRRTTPGQMGLGTSDPAHRPPAGWVRPKPPPPLTGNHRPRGGRR